MYLIKVKWICNSVLPKINDIVDLDTMSFHRPFNVAVFKDYNTGTENTFYYKKDYRNRSIEEIKIMLDMRGYAPIDPSNLQDLIQSTNKH